MLQLINNRGISLTRRRTPYQHSVRQHTRRHKGRHIPVRQHRRGTGKQPKASKAVTRQKKRVSIVHVKAGGRAYNFETESLRRAIPLTYAQDIPFRKITLRGVFV